MKLSSRFTLVALLIFGGALAEEAPPGMTVFNVNCPAPKLLPSLDHAYHECNNGFGNGSCDSFVETLRKLLPEYDCQRPFDATPDKKFIVPALWLAGDAEMEDYVRLLSRLASPKDKLFSDPYYDKVRAAAKLLFASEEFRGVLDGALAETYGPLSRAAQRALERDRK